MRNLRGRTPFQHIEETNMIWVLVMSATVGVVLSLLVTERFKIDS